MQPDDDGHYTYNQLSNDDKQLLLANGYVPGELQPDEAREILADLRANSDDDNDDDATREGVIADERDGND